MRRRLVLSALLLMLWISPAPAQFAVIDAANLGQNTATTVQTTISAIQNTITAIEAVLQSGYMVLELTPVDGLVTGGIGEDMAALGDIVSQAEGLSYDISSLQSQIAALFDLDNPPDTTSLLRERLGEIRRVRHQGYSYALKVQTLLATAARTVDHVMGLLDSIGAFVGQMSANQRMSESHQVLNKSVANMQVTTAAYERAKSVDQMEQLLIEASLERINAHVWDRE